MEEQAIRDIQFREKLRGYHPADVDAFVAEVASTVAELRRRLAAAEAQPAPAAGVAPVAPDLDDSLRRTLVLAQRTADAAIAEAKEEAAALLADAHAQRDAVHAESGELRQRLLAEAEADGRDERQRLADEAVELAARRSALLSDIEALEAHLAGERERLQRYFSDQLQRVSDGAPGFGPHPELSDGGSDPVASPGSDDGGPPGGEGAGIDGSPEAGGSGQAGSDDEPHREEAAATGTAETERPGQATASAAGEPPETGAPDPTPADDDEPLGPRDTPPAEGDADAFDLFASGANRDTGGFGSRLRRRR